MHFFSDPTINNNSAATSNNSEMDRDARAVESFCLKVEKKWGQQMPRLIHGFWFLGGEPMPDDFFDSSTSQQPSTSTPKKQKVNFFRNTKTTPKGKEVCTICNEGVEKCICIFRRWEEEEEEKREEENSCDSSPLL